MATFNKRMKELRAEKNITLEELAKVLNTTKSTLSRYENNLRTPNADFINQLAKYFNVSADYLLGNSDIKKPSLESDIPQEYTDKYKVTKKDIEQHDEVIKHAQAFMMDDEVGEEDKEKLVAVINKLYWDSKAKNKEKFGRKKEK
ncbi:transcriptional regulator [Clostridium tyrobutyricum DIVETGP]|uniref:Transcriptional regulator n=1 Tax=Clostridium tyrobutyricum DIVETGP TaxID=1408889 RepID=W6N5X5_CLOTY|nr:helix-turn-helix transcriptional regulator [Clostridium tyrobutyricum]AND84225.1 transcriptional regulator [Clostridium tyrobutyricum]AND84309.1 transcriptional regulator [Clostridium tyrobutyricum]ANP68948.1 XRE family transcriptional regulator [Clostridium tyrobutyricum]CDL91525.1 transcriptional regulator [Clostridium tyrobutyricum DIVETGP]